MSRQPIFNVPGIVLAVLALIGAVHAWLAFLPEAEEMRRMVALAFVPARFTGLAGQLPGGEPAKWTSFVTHQVVHGDLTHLAINSAWLLAFGSAVAKRVGAVRFLALAILSGICGAATFLFFHWGEAVPMVGASGAISGLMAAGLRLLMPAIDEGLVEVMRESPRSVPLLPLGAALRHRRLMLASAAFVGINLLIAVAAPLIAEAGIIAWEAHLGGFVAGFVLLGLVDPGPTPRPIGPWST